jgi:dipeptidyl-peptidase 4
MHRRIVITVFIFLAGMAASAAAPAQSTDPSVLTIDRIFNSDEFDAKNIGALRWLKSGDAYTKLEPSADIKGGMDLVSYDAATNVRNTLIPASKLIPKG